ncbi:hypothetical protein D3C84_966420 [compost metagenome]
MKMKLLSECGICHIGLIMLAQIGFDFIGKLMCRGRIAAALASIKQSQQLHEELLLTPIDL